MQTKAATSAVKENNISVSAQQAGQASNLLAASAVARMNTEAANRDRALLNEAGADTSDEEGLGEEQVMVVEGAEEAGEGLFGGAIAGVATAGTGGLAAVGLAVAGAAGSTETSGNGGVITAGTPGPVQIANAESAGINVGPSDDGSVLVSGGKTDVGALGSTTPNASINKLSLLNPEAPLPSGNPISVDAETQTLGLNLGPLGSTEADVTLDTLPTTALGFVGSVSSGNIALDQLLALDVPTSIAGTDLPITSTLNGGLSQLDAALSPVTDAIQSAFGSAGASGSGLDALTGALDGLGSVPLLGDVLMQIDGAATGALPTGPLPLAVPVDTIAVPTTGTPIDAVTGIAATSIGSLASGEQIPFASAVTGLVV